MGIVQEDQINPFAVTVLRSFNFRSVNPTLLQGNLERKQPFVEREINSGCLIHLSVSPLLSTIRSKFFYPYLMLIQQVSYFWNTRQEKSG